jgi:hypothetical protein
MDLRTQEGSAMRRGMKGFIVKLEYALNGRNEKDALDFLLSAVRRAADQDLDRGVETLRTDVRRPGEIGDW